MQHNYDTFSDYFNGNLSEFFSHILVDMKCNNKKYIYYYNKQSEILKKFPKLKHIIDGFEIPECIQLNKKEICALKEYIEYIYVLQDLENFKVFEAGKKEEYFELKNIGIVK